MKKLIVSILFLTSLSCTTLKDDSYKEILENAEHDIKVDSVKDFTYGLSFIKPMLSERLRDTMSVESIKVMDSINAKFDKIEVNQKLIEGIYNKYGLYKKNLGCIIDKQTSILSKEYKKITNPYLEKRNGKGWREKMQKEIDSIN